MLKEMSPFGATCVTARSTVDFMTGIFIVGIVMAPMPMVTLAVMLLAIRPL